MTGIQAESFLTAEAKAYADSKGAIDANIDQSVRITAV